MAKIRNFVLPPELNAQLVKEINEAPDDAVLDWGRTFIPGGFTKTRAIRERLAAGLRSGAAVEPWLLELLRTSLRGRPTIEALTAEAIRDHSDALIVMMGGPVFALALLTDAREEVHKLGIETLPRALAEFTEEEKRRAKFELHLLLEDLFFDFIPPLPSPGSDEDEFDDDLPVPEIEAPPKLPESVLEKQLTEQQERIQRLERFLEDEKRRHKTDVKEQAQRAEEQKVAFAAQLEQARTELKRAEEEKQSLQRALEQLRAERDRAIAQGIEEQTSALVRKWLHEPVELQRAAESIAGDLLARAEQALELQAREDRVSGNRRELQRQVDEFRAARERLLQAEQSAIRPLGTLREVRDDVETEIERIERLLEGRRPESEWAAKFLAQINATAERSELRRYSGLVDDLGRIGCLSALDRRKLYDALQRKFSLLDERDNVTDGRTGDSGWSLRNAIYRNLDTIVMFDGHNILFGLSDIFRPDYEEGVPKQRARQRLVRMVQCLIDSRPKVNGLIFFDGPSGTFQKVAPNLRVEFSGGTGEHRADQLIIAICRAKRIRTGKSLL